MKIYVIHYDKLHQRKAALETALAANGLKAEWLIQRGHYTQQFIAEYFEYSRESWTRKVRTANRPIIFRPLTVSEIHLTINHFLVGKRIADGNDSIALVLEDDAVLTVGFREALDAACQRLNSHSWDIAYLDYLGGTPPSVESAEVLFCRGKYDYYGTCAYLIKRSAWQRILSMNEKFTLPADEELKYRLNELGLKAVWLVPPLVTQSSLTELNGRSGQDQREKQGIKKYISWRKPLYARLPRAVRERLYRAERFVKMLLLGIN